MAEIVAHFHQYHDQLVANLQSGYQPVLASRNALPANLEDIGGKIALAQLLSAFNSWWSHIVRFSAHLVTSD